MAACLAYLWIIYVAAQCERGDWVRVIHRGNRGDVSLFQLGLRFLNYILNEDLPIPVAFQMEM